MENIKGSFLLEGNLEIGKIERLKDEIDKNIDMNQSELHLEFGEIEDCDLSFIQLFYSLFIYCLDNKIKVVFKNEIPEIIKETTARCGMKPEELTTLITSVNGGQ